MFKHAPGVRDATEICRDLSFLKRQNGRAGAGWTTDAATLRGPDPNARTAAPPGAVD